jgi:hypothetical protein
MPGASEIPRPKPDAQPAGDVLVRISKTIGNRYLRVDVAFDPNRYIHVATLPIDEIDPGSVYEAAVCRDGKTHDLTQRPKTIHWPR